MACSPASLSVCSPRPPRSGATGRSTLPTSPASSPTTTDPAQLQGIDHLVVRALLPARADCLVTRSKVLGELMTAEVVELAGPRGKHDPARDTYRHGVEDGSVTLGGRRVPVARPRVRSLAGEEVHLASYDTLTAVDLRTEHPVAAMLAGLSHPPLRRRAGTGRHRRAG